MVSRRQFMRGDFKTRKAPQRPPWALAEEAFANACSRCGECLPVCPTRIIVLVRGYPEVDFQRGACTFCGACVAACEDGALLRAEDHAAPWTIKAQIAGSCLPKRGVECRICGDHCAVAAIRFSPRLGGPPVAEVDADSCTGCGACVAPCPVAAISIA
ncbi:MAG: ferredoxin-type protein NapF [Sulfuritalea sp.]|nr:ferredoxin-type protein NapF [Sulfuritalea sp.]